MADDSGPTSGRRGISVDQDGKSNIWSIEPTMKVVRAPPRAPPPLPPPALSSRPRPPPCHSLRDARRRDDLLALSARPRVIHSQVEEANNGKNAAIVGVTAVLAVVLIAGAFLLIPDPNL